MEQIILELYRSMTEEQKALFMEHLRKVSESEAGK